MTSMARSSGAVVSGMLQPGVYSDRKSGYDYSVISSEAGYSLRMIRDAAASLPFSRDLLYFIGSGSVARSFITANDGFLFEAPLSYYRTSSAWHLSPGYESYSYPYLTRAVAPRCLDCHATQIRPVAGTQNGFGTPPFQEGGIGCERCHGPGSAHVRTQLARDIVNPAKLAKEPRDSVCAQCHLTGDVRVERAGRSQQAFRAGDKLADYSIAFVRASSGPRVRVTSHVENLAQSRCLRESGGKLWCGTCHDPHVEPQKDEKAAWYRAKCLTCHATTACKAPGVVRVAVQDDCVSCHMPKGPVTDAEHVAYTDHSIPRMQSALNARAREDDALVPFGTMQPTTRDLGLAYAIVALRENSASAREKAFDLLRPAEKRSPSEPQTLSYLADLYRTRGDHTHAAELYERLLQVDPTQSAAPVALGGYAMERGDYDGATRLWRQALRISPALILVRMNLAVALVRMGQREAAVSVLEKGIEFNPASDAARAMLRDIRAGRQPSAPRAR